MIRPEHMLNSNCSLWEEQIDSQLRSHNWELSNTCEVRLRDPKCDTLDNLLSRYRDLGWKVKPSSNTEEDFRVFVFTLVRGVPNER